MPSIAASAPFGRLMPDVLDHRQARPLLVRLARLRVRLGFAVGVLALWLARPTRSSLVIGCAVAIVGEAVRIWAVGHLEKGRGLTTSGPYRWTRHPLYVGSAIVGGGFAVASARLPVALLVGVYLVVTLTAAIRIEEVALRARFGDEYDAYQKGQAGGADRRFSTARVRGNREQRAVLGLLAVVMILAMKAWAGQVGLLVGPN